MFDVGNKERKVEMKTIMESVNYNKCIIKIFMELISSKYKISNKNIFL
jgi:hypothetical protein